MDNESQGYLGQILGITNQGYHKRISADAYTGGIDSIDTKHAAIHNGQAFYMDFYNTIAAGKVYKFHGVNTSSKYIHLQPPSFAEGKFLIEFIKDATYTPQTTVNNPTFNLNLGSSNEATFKVYPQDPTLAVTGGTVFAREYMKPANQVIEWILPPQSSFLATFANLDTTNSLQYFLRLFWYELG